MVNLILASACHEIESFIFGESDITLSELTEKIAAYRSVLPAHFFEPILNFVFNELTASCSLLEDSPEVANLIIWQELVNSFQCLRQKIFVSCINNEPAPLVEFN